MLVLTIFRFSVFTHLPERSAFLRRISNHALQRRSRPRHKPVNNPPPLTDINPDDLSYNEINFVDPGRAETDSTWQDYSTDSVIAAITVGPSSRRDAMLLPPRNKDTLYQNLLYLIGVHDPSPPLTFLIDYHDLYPMHQSTRSYNTLISLALYQGCPGTVQWLLQSMKAKDLPPNMETTKHRVRWLVRTKRLREAFTLVRRLSFEDGNYARTSNGQELRSHQKKWFPIWLELFRTSIPGATSDGRQNENQSLPKSLSPRTMTPVPPHARLITLKSQITPEMLSETSPGLAYHMIRFLFQVGDSSAARSMTNTYLSNLPRQIPRNWARWCLHILHLHLKHGCPNSNGLPRFFELRRTLFDLLKRHDHLQPTSTTLLLLLVPLGRVKRCGTIAWKVLNSFKPRIRRKIVDSRVRRRVVILADKEGRKDIVEKVLSHERSFRLARLVWRTQESVLGGRRLSPYERLRRPPQRKVFRGHGKEMLAWHLLRRRKLSRTIAKQRGE